MNSARVALFVLGMQLVSPIVSGHIKPTGCRRCPGFPIAAFRVRGARPGVRIPSFSAYYLPHFSRSLSLAIFSELEAWGQLR